METCASSKEEFTHLRKRGRFEAYKETERAENLPEKINREKNPKCEFLTAVRGLFGVTWGMYCTGIPGWFLNGVCWFVVICSAL